MILEEETFEVFGYYPSKLSLQNHKRILVVCELCGEIRVPQRRDYRFFCPSCSHILGGKMKGKNNINFGKYGKNSPTFGRRHTLEEKVLISAAAKVRKGRKNSFFAKHHTEEARSAISTAAKKRTGKKNPNFKGGKRASDARRKAKRKRDLGYTLLIPLAEGEVGHHVTNEYVIGVPTKVHRSFNYNSRKKHRTRVLQWLKTHDKKKYKKVLCVLALQPL